MIAGNRPHPLLQMLGGLALLLIIAALGLYLAGWLMVRTDSNKATLEVKTAEIQEAADDALVKGQAILKEAIEPATTTSREASAPVEDPQGPVVR